MVLERPREPVTEKVKGSLAWVGRFQLWRGIALEGSCFMKTVAPQNVAQRSRPTSQTTKDYSAIDRGFAQGSFRVCYPRKQSPPASLQATPAPL